MLERSSKKTDPKYSNESSNLKNPAAVALGQLGGQKGGIARAIKLTAAQRSQIARKAARARWHNKQT